MSDPSHDPLLEWFKQNYPREYHLQDEIASRAEEIFRNVVTQIPEGQTLPILIRVTRRPEAPRLGIVMNGMGMIFVGAMSRAILESLTAQLEGLLSSGIGSSVIKEKVQEVLHSQSPSTPLVSSTTKKMPEMSSRQQSPSTILRPVWPETGIVGEQDNNFYREKRCTECGYPNRSIAKYCAMCGYKLLLL